MNDMNLLMESIAWKITPLSNQSIKEYYQSVKELQILNKSSLNKFTLKIQEIQEYSQTIHVLMQKDNTPREIALKITEKQRAELESILKIPDNDEYLEDWDFSFSN